MEAFLKREKKTPTGVQSKYYTFTAAMKQEWVKEVEKGEHMLGESRLRIRNSGEGNKS